MQELIDFSQKAKTSRNNYIIKYNKFIQENQLNEEIKFKKIGNNIDKLDKFEIDNFGEDIIDVFEKYKSQKKYLYPVKLINESLDFSDLHKLFDEKIKKIQYRDGKDAFNCSKQYYDCINKIKEFGIDIYAIEIDISRYKNGNISYSDDEDYKYKPFKFYCGKNNYKFNFSYYDSYRYCPGIFCTKKIININTDEIIKIDCDLYCQNRCEGQLREFLKILEHSDYKNYVEKQVECYIGLIQLLKDRGFQVNRENWVRSHNIHIVDAMVTNHTKFKINNKEYVLILDRRHKDTYLYICTKYKYPFGVNSNKLSQKPYFQIKYDSIDKFNDLCNCITEYVNYIFGLYGFYNKETLLFQNEYDFKELFFESSRPMYQYKINYKKKTMYNSDKDFDIDINYVCKYNMKYVLPKSYIDSNCICDNYRLNFWYDKYDGSNSCHVTIQGKYIDLTTLSIECGWKLNIEDDINLINKNLVKFNGSFDECMKYICTFFSNI